MTAIRPLTIALAEDNIDHAELMIETLEEFNLCNRIIHVANGVELLKLLRSQPPYDQGRPAPDIVLLDIKMPLLGGIDTLAEIKKDPALKSLPVIMVTTSKNDTEIKACFELGANSYITKPLQFEDFAKKMRDLNVYWIMTSELPGKEIGTTDEKKLEPQMDTDKHR